MKRKIQQLSCKSPDRHDARMVCGYPLPCPFHTLVADVREQTVTVPIGSGDHITIPAESAGRVGDITKALRGRR